MEKVEPTSESRHLIYHQGSRTAIFKVTAKYAPDIETSHYGSVDVKMLYPVKKTLATGYPLELFPNVRDAKDASGHFIGIEDNVEPTSVGIRRLFVEGNKVAGLLTKSTLCIPSKKFSYNNMRVVDLDTTPLMLAGVVETGDAELCKGDLITIEELDVTEEGKHFWKFTRARVVPNSWSSKFKSWIDCTFRSAKYANRYATEATGKVPINNVRVLGAGVEEETYR